MLSEEGHIFSFPGVQALLHVYPMETPVPVDSESRLAISVRALCFAINKLT